MDAGYRGVVGARILQELGASKPQTLQTHGTTRDPIRTIRNDHLALAAGWRGVSPVLMSLHRVRELCGSQPWTFAMGLNLPQPI